MRVYFAFCQLSANAVVGDLGSVRTDVDSFFNGLGIKPLSTGPGTPCLHVLTRREHIRLFRAR